MSKIGPTGEPPRSGIPGDRGGLDVALSIRGDMICVEFGTSLTFFAMTAEEADVFIGALAEKLVSLRRRATP